MRVNAKQRELGPEGADPFYGGPRRGLDGGNRRRRYATMTRGPRSYCTARPGPKGAATCEELATNERITTPSVQGGAGLELHEVRWKTGTDRPPSGESSQRDRPLCEVRTRRTGAMGAQARPGESRCERPTGANSFRVVEHMALMLPDSSEAGTSRRCAQRSVGSGWVNAPGLKAGRPERSEDGTT